ncbi:MAG: hypothetical protein JO145_09720 [Acidobacteriaceae bacterium]|nr:hypothetical protein [Acidobacteriaceae bacterium]MBV9766420.1 hypothetical protein [Acidobacteriaceae bacterium]
MSQSNNLLNAYLRQPSVRTSIARCYHAESARYCTHFLARFHNSAKRNGSLAIATIAAIASVAIMLCAPSGYAQTARDVKGATPLVAIQDEAPARLIVDPPIPEQLALGRVFIQYRTENLRILPVFGKAALAVSPRVGHLHYYVDDQSWATVDTSGETIALVGLSPGPHKVRLELADAAHKPIPGASKVVELTVPATTATQH